MTDQLGRYIDTSIPFKRIVCLVPSQTALLYDLGLEHLLVGITKFCVHPPHLKDHLAIVGGTKNIHWDTLKSLKPDIVLCNKEENTQQIVAQLETFTQVHIADIYTLEDCFELIQQYGVLFNVVQKGECIIEQIRASAKEYHSFLAEKTPEKVAYLIWRKPWMLAGGDTFINHMLEVAGFDNAFKDLSRYPEVELSDIQKSAIDFLFLSSEPYPFKEKHKAELREEFTNAEIVLVNGEFFSWYGSRLTSAFDYFKTLKLQLKSKKAD